MKIRNIFLMSAAACSLISVVYAMQPAKKAEKATAVPTSIRPIDQALINAVKARDVNESNRLLAAGANSNAVDAADWSTLIRDSAY